MSKRLRTANVSDQATSTILSQQGSKNRRYLTSQRRYLNWCHLHHKPTTANAATLISFLDHERAIRDWAIGTTINAKTHILDLYNTADQQLIKTDRNYIDYIKALRASHVPEFIDYDYNLLPIFNYIQAMGSNDSMTRTDLTHKTAWLLAMAGFFRPSDLHRIDLDHARINPDGKLILQVLAPKDKKAGLHYVKTVTLHPHVDPIFCPVQAYSAYIRRCASLPARGPHPLYPDVTINFLFRSLDNSSHKVNPETISRYIRTVMTHLGGLPNSRGPPKARALSSSIAAKAGLEVDAIVAHGGWASPQTFDHFYRMSTETNQNFTTAVLATLDQQPRSQSGKCNVM
jgi:hypothetical protein